MNIRPTQSSTFALVQNGLLANFGKLVDAQSQISSGKRILRASDDPVGSAQALTLKNRTGALSRFLDAIQGGARELDLAAGVLQDAGGLIAEARALTLQALNGATNAEDRGVIADQLRDIKAQLADLANSKAGGRYLFAGTALGDAPFRPGDHHGFQATDYAGNGEQQLLLVGDDLRLALGVPGGEVFAGLDPSGVVFEGLTGASRGQTADQGTGAVTLFVRHDSTALSIAGGVALAAGGANDTLLGSHTLSIDPVAGTATLDSGPARSLPASGSPEYSDFEFTNAAGDSVHLDLTGWTGGAAAGTVDGAGSISLDGALWTAIDFTSTDVELIDGSLDRVLHVDVRAIHRSGNERVSFGGTVNVFDTLESIADALDNAEGLSKAEQDRRVQLFFDELDRNHDNVLGGLSTVGARSGRMKSLEEQYGAQGVELSSQISRIEDADMSQVVLEMMRAEQTLQLTQSIGSRLLQTSLLDFLR